MNLQKLYSYTRQAIETYELIEEGNLINEWLKREYSYK